MYKNTLSTTSENILSFLLNNLENQYSIREISKAIKQDYKIVHTTIKKQTKTIEIKQISNINQCKPKLKKENAALFGLISQKYANKKLPKIIWNAAQDITTTIKNPFYVFLIFGSYAKENAKTTSDIDALFIIAERHQEKEIEAAVKKSATLNNQKINPIILTQDEWNKGIQEKSVAQEAYKKHLIIKGGETFYTLISHA